MDRGAAHGNRFGAWSKASSPQPAWRHEANHNPLARGPEHNPLRHEAKHALLSHGPNHIPFSRGLKPDPLSDGLNLHSLSYGLRSDSLVDARRLVDDEAWKPGLELCLDRDSTHEYGFPGF